MAVADCMQGSATPPASGFDTMRRRARPGARRTILSPELFMPIQGDSEMDASTASDPPPGRETTGWSPR